MPVLTGWVFVDIAGRDIGSYVAEAREIVLAQVKLPAGYAVTWSGQFEEMEKARAQLMITIPAVIVTIFVLLMIHFGRLDRTLIIMLSLPFGLIGGLWTVYLAGYNLSVAVAVGFIALGGIAVETAVVMLLYIDAQVRAHPPKDRHALFDAIIEGAVMRVRPKLMTVSVIIAGLLPIFFTQGLGSDVMRRIALPMVGGMVSHHHTDPRCYSGGLLSLGRSALSRNFQTDQRGADATWRKDQKNSGGHLNCSTRRHHHSFIRQMKTVVRSKRIIRLRRSMPIPQNIKSDGWGQPSR